MKHQDVILSNKDARGRTPFLAACANNKIEVLYWLKDHFGTSQTLEASDKDGFSPLTVAAAKGHVDVISFLEMGSWDAMMQKFRLLGFTVQDGSRRRPPAIRGVSVTQRDSAGRTAINAAAVYGQTKVIEYLMTKPNVDPYDYDGKGRTMLTTAAVYGQVSVFEFFKGELDFTKLDNTGRTPITAAASNGHLNVVRFLAALPTIHPSASDGKHENAVSAAIAKGRIDIVKYLAGYPDFDLTKSDANGFTPMTFAAYKGWPNIIKLLESKLGTKALNGRDDQGYTPMKCAMTMVSKFKKHVLNNIIITIISLSKQNNFQQDVLKRYNGCSTRMHLFYSMFAWNNFSYIFM